MRRFWVRIGVGAAVVFAGGMFVITLARQVKGAAAEALQSGSSFSVPFNMLAFQMDGRRVGSVRSIDVRRGEGRRVRQVNIDVRLKGFDASDLGECALVLGGGHGGGELFDCVDPAELDGRYRQIGQARFEPGGVTRPILVEWNDSPHWFREGDFPEVRIEAGEVVGGLNITGSDADGSFSLKADATGLRIHATDASGTEVVKLDAGAKGVEIKVEKK